MSPIRHSLVALCGLFMISAPQAMAAERIVSAGAGVTELILALDGAAKLAAVDVTSSLPAKLANLPKVGYHRQLGSEGILALGPDLLVGSDAMGPKTTLDTLRQAGVEVLVLPTASGSDELKANIHALGKHLNQEQKAAALASDVEQRLTKLKQQKVSGKVLFVLMQSGRPARVGGKGTAADSIITLAGVSNIADFEGYRDVSAEGLLVMAPELILVANRGEAELSADKVLEQIPLLAHTPAGKKGAIQVLPGAALIGGVGLGAISAAEALQAQFAPEN
ncbi:ABC transporter substrate-binding protein [Shewanella sp. JM162201]|uniref:ABC transporter substrate-binding protein n=1 Tax=Shewanella jiangmenensis TaxID=2837387 RepID=A0ABS5UZS9_9GAMM|nr:ABC transporter substrate-binding protein [Shewanella jiangmenensis]MBT1443712.1 ABC transporter substrate-binding protein [Shewanella jiangmenensis]